MGAGFAVAGYAAFAAAAWWRYGHPRPSSDFERDELLDQFIPTYDVVERHRIWVAASADETFAAAKQQDLLHSRLIRAIFRAREIALAAIPDERARPRGLVDQMQSLGWGVLAELPGREIVMGAVTKPWEANVTFHAIPANEFASYWQPGYVKIVWTLRARPAGSTGSVFFTETRAVATDPVAWARFRKYWAFASPGIASIRWLLLRPLKRTAERRTVTETMIRFNTES